MTFGVWVFRLIVLLFVMWLHRRRVACRYLHLTINMAWEACNYCCRTAHAKTWCWRFWLTFTDWKSHGLVTGDNNRRYWHLKCPVAPADWPQTWFAWCCGSQRTIGSQRRPRGCHCLMKCLYLCATTTLFLRAFAFFRLFIVTKINKGLG